MPALPSGTVTLLFTDIEGSTQLLRRLGDAYADTLAAHQRLLREAFAAHGGHEVDTQGDAFFVAFSGVVDAVQAAVAAQRALTNHPWPEGAAVGAAHRGADGSGRALRRAGGAPRGAGRVRGARRPGAPLRGHRGDPAR